RLAAVERECVIGTEECNLSQPRNELLDQALAIADRIGHPDLKRLAAIAQLKFSTRLDRYGPAREAEKQLDALPGKPAPWLVVLETSARARLAGPSGTSRGSVTSILQCSLPSRRDRSPTQPLSQGSQRPLHSSPGKGSPTERRPSGCSARRSRFSARWSSDSGTRMASGRLEPRRSSRFSSGRTPTHRAFSTSRISCSSTSRCCCRATPGTEPRRSASHARG